MRWLDAHDCQRLAFDYYLDESTDAFAVERRPDRRRPKMAAMVILSKIYTRTGDAGTTRLGDMSEVSKTDLRLETYAYCDEANSQIGYAIAVASLEPAVSGAGHVQNDLFDVGADLSCPVVEDPAVPTAAGRAGLHRSARGLVRRVQRAAGDPSGRSSCPAVRREPRCCMSRGPSYGARSEPAGRLT